MKVIIAGGRDFKPQRHHGELLVALHKIFNFTEIVSGRAKGADSFGERFARTHGITIAPFPADWDKHGKKAGYLRNYDMANYGDTLIAFRGGIGTANMIKLANKHGLVIIFNENVPDFSTSKESAWMDDMPVVNGQSQKSIDPVPIHGIVNQQVEDEQTTLKRYSESSEVTNTSIHKHYDDNAPQPHKITCLCSKCATVKI